MGFANLCTETLHVRIPDHSCYFIMMQHDDLEQLPVMGYTNLWPLLRWGVFVLALHRNYWVKLTSVWWPLVGRIWGYICYTHCSQSSKCSIFNFWDRHGDQSIFPGSLGLRTGTGLFDSAQCSFSLQISRSDELSPCS